MKIVFVHGIHQDGKDPIGLQKEWTDALRSGLIKLGVEKSLENCEIAFPYYGDVLAAHVKSEEKTRGDNSTSGASLFIEEGMSELLHEELSIVEPSISTKSRGKGPHKVAVKSVARLIELASPLKGALALRLLKQAYAYLMLKPARDAVDDIVRPHLTSSHPTVVISHSLGTVVSYRLLLELQRENKLGAIPLLVTMGSPLSLRLMKRHLFATPETIENVMSWVNVADQEDFVALGDALDSVFLKMEIENHILKGRKLKDPHALESYVSTPEVCQSVAKVIL